MKKIKFVIKVTILTVVISLYLNETKKICLKKLFYLHCSNVIGQSVKENLKGIKTLPEISGDPESLKKSQPFESVSVNVPIAGEDLLRVF